MSDTSKENPTPTLGFIGAGNMASAIISGLLSEGYPPQNIWATDTSEDRLKQLHTDWGICTTTDNQQAAASVDVLVLAVKPQVLEVVAKDLRAILSESKPLIVSIAAGIMSSSITSWLGEKTAIVRCMPNTPSLVGEGASGLYANEHVSALQRAQAEQVMRAVGIALWVDEEEHLDAVTAVSGSGPAYYFLMMEAMIAAGESLGLDTATSTKLTLQTALGAAKMALASDVAPAELRRRVTSPNGTTEKAIEAFEQGGMRPLVNKALEACAERSKSLAKELGSD